MPQHTCIYAHDQKRVRAHASLNSHADTQTSRQRKCEAGAGSRCTWWDPSESEKHEKKKKKELNAQVCWSIFTAEKGRGGGGGGSERESLLHNAWPCRAAVAFTLLALSPGFQVSAVCQTGSIQESQVHHLGDLSWTTRPRLQFPPHGACVCGRGGCTDVSCTLL